MCYIGYYKDKRVSKNYKRKIKNSQGTDRWLKLVVVKLDSVVILK